MAFFIAKNFINENGYAEEALLHDSISYDEICEREFLNEAAWVILNSGMRESIIRKIYPSISEAFCHWDIPELLKNEPRCKKKALGAFNNIKKIEAIFFIAKDIQARGINQVKSDIKSQGIAKIQDYPFMGKATSFHFAKNIGIETAKPDRHLLRIARAAGYCSPELLCQEIAYETGEKVSVVDLIFWRFATIEKNYLKIFNA